MRPLNDEFVGQCAPVQSIPYFGGGGACYILGRGACLRLGERSLGYPDCAHRAPDVTQVSATICGSFIFGPLMLCPVDL